MNPADKAKLTEKIHALCDQHPDIFGPRPPQGQTDQIPFQMQERVTIEKFDHSGPTKRLIETVEVDHVKGTIKKIVHDEH